MFELTPKLDIHSEDPLYVQLYEYIKLEMKTGKLLPRTKLPSKRKLASYLKISQNTIESAYGQLAAEGYIEAVPRKGYYVCEVDSGLLNLNGDNTEDIAEKPHIDRDYIYDFAHTGIDAHTFPYGLYRKLVCEVVREENEKVLTIGHPQGEFELRESIAKYVYESRGVKCSPSQIIIGSGTQFLIRMLFQLLEEGIFAVEDPGYHRKLVAFEKGYENVKMIPLDQDGIIISSLEESRADAVFVTPSHHFPCGMIMPISRRMQLLKWAEQKAGRYIIEDDYDSEFRYVGKPIPALQGLDAHKKVIYMGTFSKALLPSLRISYMILPKILIKKFHEEYFFFNQTVSRIDQDILTRFLKDGHWEKHIHRMRVVYQKKRDVLVAAISEYLPHTVKIIGQDSGLHLLVRVNNGMTERELIEAASQFQVKVYPVSYYGQNDNQTVLLGFAKLSEEQVKKAVRLLHQAWFSS